MRERKVKAEWKMKGQQGRYKAAMRERKVKAEWKMKGQQ